MYKRQEGVAKKVDGLKRRMDINDIELEGKIEKVLNKKVRGNRSSVPPALRSRIRDMPLMIGGPVTPSSENPPVQVQGVSSHGTRTSENYWRARRGLRIWPITGSDLVQSTLLH